MSICAPHHLPIRKTPAHEGREVPKYTEHIFVTCCTRSKINALDNHDVHALLVSLWMDTSHWIVTRYVIMPDHVHFMAYASRSSTITLRGWAAWWKAQATRKLGFTAGTLWLPDLWDTRMRSQGHWAAKMAYMRENPVRAGLVTTTTSWPFQGDLVACVVHTSSTHPRQGTNPNG